MPLSQYELEKREAEILAPYAQKSVDSRGRRFSERTESWRTGYQRDRDRIIHTRSFRRLEYKTQVFINGIGDHLRTRLTHTMEVAAIARNLARSLGLNEDLTEAISLAHDLGHSPFGHNGDETLDKIMKGSGGFEHNRQSLRIVEFLEQKFPDFDGLNLNWEVREGLARHDRPESENSGIPTCPSVSLEAQIAELADEIAYYSHDLDDGIRFGVLKPEELPAQIAVWSHAEKTIRSTHGQASPTIHRHAVIRTIIDLEIQDVAVTTEKNLERAKITSSEAVRRYPEALAAYSEKLTQDNKALRNFLYQELYLNPEIHDLNDKAVEVLKQLFDYYRKHPVQLSEQARSRIATEGLDRTICDYISGMTDRYALSQAASFGIEVNDELLGMPSKNSGEDRG